MNQNCLTIILCELCVSAVIMYEWRDTDDDKSR